MKKILFVVTSILIIGLCWFGYKWISTQQINTKLTQEAKAEMVAGMLDIEDLFIRINVESKKDSINSDIFFWSGVNMSIDRVLTSSRILENNYRKSNRDMDVIKSIRLTFRSLQSLVAQSMEFSQNNQSFMINNCENLKISNIDDLQYELQKYKNLLTFSLPIDPVETDAIWRIFIENWDIGQATLIYKCNMP